MHPLADVLLKKMLWKTLQIRGQTPSVHSFLVKVQTWAFRPTTLLKRTLLSIFPGQFCEIFRKTFFIEYLRLTDIFFNFCTLHFPNYSTWNTYSLRYTILTGKMYYWKCISENQSQTQQKKIRLFFLKNDCRKKKSWIKSSYYWPWNPYLTFNFQKKKKKKNFISKFYLIIVELCWKIQVLEKVDVCHLSMNVCYLSFAQVL